MFLTRYSNDEMINVAGLRECHRDATSKRFVAAPASVAKRDKLESAGRGIFDDARSTSKRSNWETPHLATN